MGMAAVMDGMLAMLTAGPSFKLDVPPGCFVQFLYFLALQHTAVATPLWRTLNKPRQPLRQGFR